MMMTTTTVQQPQQQSSNSVSNQKPLSFDDVSKFFTLPLSDAADSLGVCTTTLKKICNDNGLVRWPYRKFLSGKSIEEIKKDAAREVAELSKASGERNDAFAGSAVSTSLGSQLQNKASTAARGVTQQAGNKNVQNGSSQNLQISNLTKGAPASLDEFKYGFPSDGLSTTSYRWWGSKSPGHEDSHENGGDDAEENKLKSLELVEDGTTLQLDKEKSESGRYESNVSHQGTGLLLAVRKRAAEGGQELLKLGSYRCDGVNKLSRKERTLLLGIFKSSLPRQWGHDMFRY